MRIGLSSRSGRGNGPGGLIAMAIFGLIFGSMGLVFVVMAVRDGQARRATLSWTPTPCVIDSSALNDDGDRYRFDLTYRYSWQGREHVGRGLTHSGSARCDSITEGQRLLERYPHGAHVTCYVNPAAPAESVIERRTSLASLLLPVMFSSLFVLAGYGMVAFALILRRRHAHARAPTGQRPTPLAVPIVFGLVFMIAGLGATCATFVAPLRRQFAARAWEAVEAVVTKSSVRTHSGGEDTTYSVYVAYRYGYRGREYKGDRYRFLSGSSSGCEGKQTIVARYPPGSRITVYVNPAEPSESVILRDAGPALYLGLLPLIFTAVGAAVLFGGSRAVRRHNSTLAATGAVSPPRAWRLTAPAYRSRDLFLLLFFALFWNSIVAVFLRDCLLQWQRGGRPLLLTLFLAPFVLVGATVVVGVFREALRLFNPRIVLEIPDRPLVPGTPHSLRFHGHGRLDRIERLAITLRGREVAGQQEEDQAATPDSFHVETLFEERLAGMLAMGAFRLTLPEAAMQRVATPGRRIEWLIEVRGRIAHWPDMVASYPLLPERT